jgi:molybdenum cofactor cytidylyltransferase
MGAADAESSAFLSGVILAAGASTRMGRPKQLLPLSGRPVLQHVLDAVAASCLDEAILVLGHDAAAVRAAIELPSGIPTRVVVNPGYLEGQSSSLRVGLGAADPRAVAAAILLADEPFVTRRLIDRVAAAFLAHGAPAARPLYSGSHGRPVPGHPVFLARRIWPEMEKLRGDEGARALLAARPEWLLEVPVESEPPGDLDTWQDYQRAIEVHE